MSDHGQRLTATDVLPRYREDAIPDFVGRPLDHVDDVGRDGDYPIHVAGWRAVDELTALLDGGADVNAVGEFGQTPLPAAVRRRAKDLGDIEGLDKS